MSSIQFSYPQMSGTLDETNQKIRIVNNGGSYFDLTYTNGENTTVLHFVPTRISFIDTADDYMIIEHTNNSGKSLKIRFKVKQMPTAIHGITSSDIYINQLIGDGIESNKMTINGKSVNVGLSGTDYTIDFSTCGEIPIKTIDTNFNGGTFVSDTANFIKNDNTDISIPLTATTFMTDEIVCDEGTNNSTDNTKKTYEAKIAGNVGLSFGIGFLIFTLVVWGVTSLKFKFKVNTHLFGLGDGSHEKMYTGSLILMFLLSVSCFMAYGGVLTWGGGLLEGETTEQRDTKLSALLSTAIISFLIFVFMAGYKMIVMTPPQVANT
jgi:hypothetical protein